MFCCFKFPSFFQANIVTSLFQSVSAAWEDLQEVGFKYSAYEIHCASTNVSIPYLFGESLHLKFIKYKYSLPKYIIGAFGTTLIGLNLFSFSSGAAFQWKRSPGKEGSHFNPYSNLFAPSERKAVLTSTVCWTIMVLLLAYSSFVAGPAQVLKLYGVPYLVSYIWSVFIHLNSVTML